MSWATITDVNKAEAKEWGDGVVGLILTGSVGNPPSQVAVGAVTLFLGQDDDQVLDRVRVVRSALDEIERRVLARRPVVSEGAENGTAGTAPSATVRPWRRGDRVRLVEQIGDGTGWTLGKVYDQWTDEGRLLDDDGHPRPVLIYRGSRFELVAEQATSVACDPLPAHVEAVTAP